MGNGELLLCQTPLEKYWHMHWRWSLATSSSITKWLGCVIKKKHLDTFLSWTFLAISPLSAVILTAIHISETSYQLLSRFGFPLSALSAGLLCAGQSRRTVPDWVQVAFAAPTRQFSKTKGPYMYIMSSKHLKRDPSWGANHSRSLQLEALALNSRF